MEVFCYDVVVSTQKVIIIHGNGGATGTDHWLPSVKWALEKEGLKVITETMPDNVLAREKYWLPFLKDKLHADKNTILVGHSSGAVAAMRYAENNKIYGSVLVGACHTDLGMKEERIAGYYNRPWQWDKIKASQNWIIQFHSTDDPFIPVDEARYVHKRLNSEYTEATDEGHYGGGGREKLQFPELISAIKKKLKL